MWFQHDVALSDVSLAANAWIPSNVIAARIAAFREDRMESCVAAGGGSVGPEDAAARLLRAADCAASAARRVMAIDSSTEAGGRPRTALPSERRPVVTLLRRLLEQRYDGGAWTKRLTYMRQKEAAAEVALLCSRTLRTSNRAWTSSRFDVSARKAVTAMANATAEALAGLDEEAKWSLLGDFLEWSAQWAIRNGLKPTGRSFGDAGVKVFLEECLLPMV